MLLLEGEEKAGKTYAARKLSGSDKVNRTFVFDVGEVPSDEYAPLGRYEIVELGGTWADLEDQLAAARAEPSDGRPNVIELDTVTAMWAHLADWVNTRAKNSAKARKILEADPDAEIDAPMNLWNDAKDRWWRIINAQRAWPGITVLVARGKEVTDVQDGRPVMKNGRTQTVYKVEAEKGLPYAVTAQVRMTRTPRRAQLVGASGLHLNLEDGAPVDLPLENTLEHLIFDMLGAGVDRFVAAPNAGVVEGVDAREAKRRLLEVAAAKLGDGEEAKAACLAAWDEAGLAGARAVTADQYADAYAALEPRLGGSPIPATPEFDVDPPPLAADISDGY
jgi:hypothetical protein